MTEISRRDFLKLMAVLPASLAFSNIVSAIHRQVEAAHLDNGLPNLVILVADTLSARHLSLYGYSRKTSPNLERFAERATVYHSHYSDGNFTTPGVASLLTGMYPWTHRAINLAGLVARSLSNRNIFRLFGEKYYRAGFAQSLWADLLLNQFSPSLNNHVPPTSYRVIGETTIGPKFKSDPTAAFYAYEEFLLSNPPASAVIGLSERLYYLKRLQEIQKPEEYPRGIHGLYHINYYVEAVFDGLILEISRMPSPFLTYLHFFPPHAPYLPNKEFIGIFNDGLSPVEKPIHQLSDGLPAKKLKRYRKEYDEFIANVDPELGRLLDFFEQASIFERSYIVITSDHGELFERGVHGHSTPLLYDPVIHIPLIVSAPGQRVRRDIYAHTSSVDLVPTLLKAAGREIPDWCEGQLLPGLGGYEDAERSIFAIEAKKNSAFVPISTATVAMFKEKYKIIHYLGYSGYNDVWELYDLENDPE